MSLKVTLLVVSLISQCCSAPSRRNWTPQAILYLKGAQGHRSTLERSSREEEGAYHLDLLRNFMHERPEGIQQLHLTGSCETMLQSSNQSSCKELQKQAKADLNITKTGI